MKSHDELLVSLNSVNESNSMLKNYVNSLQEGIIGIEFEVKGSKVVSFNKTMLKCGAKLIEEGNVKFVLNENNKEVGIVYFLKPEKYENS